MGMHILGSRSCCINNSPIAAAPNPDPSRWTLLSIVRLPKAYIMKVQYKDCTNFEGRKIMVYQGKYKETPDTLDPHFSDTGHSPIARFRPNEEGWKMAIDFARTL